LHKQISYRHGKVHYYKAGNGKPCLVLLHGFLENLSMWQYIIPEFSKTHTVVAIDLPGHGKTATLADIHTMELMADVVNEVLKEGRHKTSKVYWAQHGRLCGIGIWKKTSFQNTSHLFNEFYGYGRQCAKEKRPFACRRNFATLSKVVH
jgi:hypothetical protein